MSLFVLFSLLIMSCQRNPLIGIGEYGENHPMDASQDNQHDFT
jgi:hypothetical protein